MSLMQETNEGLDKKPVARKKKAGREKAVLR